MILVPNEQGIEKIRFAKEKRDILAEFEMFFDRIVNSFENFRRPEFSKVRQVD